MDTKNIIIGVLLIANIGLSSYTIKSVNSMKEQIKIDQNEVISAIQDKEFKLSENDAELVAAKSALFNQTLRNEMTIELEKNRQAFQIYSDAYVNELISNTKNVIQTLYPTGSKSEVAKERFDALMSEMDLENHDRAVNTGVIQGQTSKEILNNDLKEQHDKMLANEQHDLLLRLKSLLPEKSEADILKMISEKNN